MSVRVTKDYSHVEKNVKIAMNKSLLKEFKNDDERIVYLENGDEFQIQIFNDQMTEIGAKITVNGEMIGNSYLVIRPGERIWLDRYLDKARKFMFSTYEVNGNNEQVQKAIKKNGLVKVELYRKKESYEIIDGIKIWPSYEPHIYYTNTPYASTTANTSCCSEPSMNYYCDSISTDNNISFSVCGNANYAVTTSASSWVSVKDAPKTNTSSKIETGRIQEGGNSDQEFNYVNMSFEYWPFDTEEIHILPKSTKPVYSDELQKTYCPNCGRKLKPKFKFCPFCGEKL